MTLTTSIKSHNVSTYIHILQYIQIINTTTCSMHNDQTSKLEHRAPVQGQHPPLRVGWPLRCLAESYCDSLSQVVVGEWLLCGIHDAPPKVTDESEGLLAKCTEGLHCYWHKVSNIKDLCMYNFCAHSVSQTRARISRYMNVYPHGNTKIVNFKLKMVFALMS